MEELEVIFGRALDVLHAPSAQIYCMDASAGGETLSAKLHTTPGVERNLVSLSSEKRAVAAGFLLKVGKELLQPFPTSRERRGAEGWQRSGKGGCARLCCRAAQRSCTPTMVVVGHWVLVLAGEPLRAAGGRLEGERGTLCVRALGPAPLGRR